MGMFSPETERLRQLLAEQMTHTTGQSAGGGVTQAKQRMGLVPPWYQTLSGERAGPGFTEALQMMADQRGDMQIGDTSINPIDFINPMAGIFGGKLAKTADLMALRDAMNRAAQGEDVRKVWQDTGWFQSPDGQWRFEIDDSASQFSQRARDAGEWPAGAGINMVGDDPNRFVLQHPQLAAAYPETGNIRSAGRDVMGSDAGSYSGPKYAGDPGQIDISMGRMIGSTDPRSISLHELQHAIQQREGFARGGSPEMFAGSRDMVELLGRENDGMPYMLEYWRRIDSGMPKKEAASGLPREAVIEAMGYESSAQVKARAKEIEGELSKWADISIDPYGAYRRLAGEAEARAVQTRMNLTPEQRRMRFPLDDYDVPVDELIMRYGDGPAMSVRQPWEMTRAEYNAPMPKAEMESMYLPIGRQQLEVVRNPTISDIGAMKKEARRKYPNLGSDEPVLRRTEDEAGNVYYWNAYDAVHDQVENILSSRVGMAVNQNAAQKTPHRNVIRRALMEGKKVPKRVLDEYPELSQ